VVAGYCNHYDIHMNPVSEGITQLITHLVCVTNQLSVWRQRNF